MSRHSRAAVVLLIATLALSGGRVQAQRGGIGRNGMNLITAAGSEAVHKELHLEDSVAENVRRIVRQHDKQERDQRNKMFEALQSIDNLPQKERDQKVKEITDEQDATTKKRHEEAVAQLKKALSAEQFVRVQQIAWQAGGSEAFATDPNLVKPLALTEDQIKKLTALNLEYREKKRQQFRLDGGFRAARARELELNKERDAKAIALLTKEQQKELAKLTGQPFDLAELEPGR